MINDSSYIFIKTGTLINKVYLSDIYAIESAGNYCTIKATNDNYIQRSFLTKMKDRLADNGFIQVNKSTLLPIDRIEHINLTINEISVGGHQYTLSRNFRKKFIDTLNLL